MKTFRYLAVVIALAIPATALAQRAMSADCCDGGACCHPGCPFCHHAK